MTNILVTGNAGFIGFHVTKRLLEEGCNVTGIDVVNDFYDVNLKQDRLRELRKVAEAVGADYQFHRVNLNDTLAVQKCFKEGKFQRVIHLAAQAGVQYSLKNPLAYVSDNILSFTNVLEQCRYFQVEHLIYASTSSVYGANTATPFSEDDSVDHPIQFYAATKRANELMAHSYSHLFNLPTTGLRFFTVYGPWGRPDMALFRFTQRMVEGRPIEVYNFGKHERDFTFVDDIVDAVVRISAKVAQPDVFWDSNNPNPSSSAAPYRIYNIGNNAPITLMKYIESLEASLEMKSEKKFLPLQPGDIPNTFADVSKLLRDVDYQPKTSVEIGVSKFVEWYRAYYKV